MKNSEKILFKILQKKLKLKSPIFVNIAILFNLLKEEGFNLSKTPYLSKLLKNLKDKGLIKIKIVPASEHKDLTTGGGFIKEVSFSKKGKNYDL